MNLLFDVGNTRIKWAFEQDGKLFAQGAILARGISESALLDAMQDYPEPAHIWISNVGSAAVLECLMSFLQKRYEVLSTQVQVSQQCCGIYNNYQEPGNLGVDRWVAAIGARSIVENGNVIVVDVGTAINIEWLSAANSYEGGVILPGTALMHDSLVGNTAGIESSFYHRDQIIGRSTSECVNSGVGFGLGGAVDRVVEEIEVEIINIESKLLKSVDKQLSGCSQNIEIVVTGGGYCSIKSHAVDRAIVEPNLVLLGLQRIARVPEEQTL